MISSEVREATSFRSTAAFSATPLRAKVSRLRTIRPARSAWSWITRRCSWGRLGSGARSSSSSVRPAMEVSGIVQLVRHARDQLADGGHLVVLDQLRLEDALLGHVLDQDDHGPAAGLGSSRLVGERSGGEPEHALVPLHADHERRGPVPAIGAADQVLDRLGAAEERLAEVEADQLGSRSPRRAPRARGWRGARRHGGRPRRCPRSARRTRSPTPPCSAARSRRAGCSPAPPRH